MESQAQGCHKRAGYTYIKEYIRSVTEGECWKSASALLYLALMYLVAHPPIAEQQTFRQLPIL